MSKYSAVRTEIDGYIFDSKREAARYQDLKLLERVGYLTHLELQPKYVVEINGKKVCTVIPDFRYLTKDGKLVVEDAKGMRSGAAYQMFRLKAKLVEALFDIRIEEI